MAYIKTVDGGRHVIKETLEEIENMIEDRRVLETGIIKLNWRVVISGRKDGEEVDESRYEPVCFVVSNIISYS